MRLCANSPIITRFSRDDVPRELLWWGIGRQQKKKKIAKEGCAAGVISAKFSPVTTLRVGSPFGPHPPIFKD